MRNLFLLFVSCCCAVRAFAQSNVPNPAQQQALAKMTASIKSVFNKLDGADWTLRSDYYSANMTLSGQQQGAPFAVNNNYGRVYVIKEGSPTYQKLIQPLLNHKMAMLTAQHADSAALIDKRIQALSRFEVYANLNQAQGWHGQLQAKTGAFTALSLKGCACASKIFAANSTEASTRHIIICLSAIGIPGNADPGSHQAAFKFKHPVNTPYIENVDVEIIGDNDFIENFVKTADWTIVADALTKIVPVVSNPTIALGCRPVLF